MIKSIFIIIHNKTMASLFRLPEDIVDKIFEYHDPYKHQNEYVLYDLRWNQFWYRSFCIWFTQQEINYPKYVLKRNRSQNGFCLKVYDK